MPTRQRANWQAQTASNGARKNAAFAARPAWSFAAAELAPSPHRDRCGEPGIPSSGRYILKNLHPSALMGCWVDEIGELSGKNFACGAEDIYPCRPDAFVPTPWLLEDFLQSVRQRYNAA
jgi:hypothetical protein